MRAGHTFTDNTRLFSGRQIPGPSDRPQTDPSTTGEEKIS